MPKTRINISLEEDTAERIRQYAWENHSSVSKAISDLIWSAKVKNSQIRGQMSLENASSPGASRKSKS